MYNLGSKSATLTGLANELLEAIRVHRKLGAASATNYAVGYLVAQLGEDKVIEIIKEIKKDS